jgi:hypothetical protein
VGGRSKGGWNSGAVAPRGKAGLGAAESDSAASGEQAFAAARASSVVAGWEWEVAAALFRASMAEVAPLAAPASAAAPAGEALGVAAVDPAADSAEAVLAVVVAVGEGGDAGFRL